MSCKCGNWVDVGKNVASVKCDSCSDIIYDLPKQEPTRELSINQYYLIIAKNGFLLLTKFKPEAKIVSQWGEVIFSGIINRSKHSVSYEIGETEHIEKFRNIPVSHPYYKKLCFDFQTLKNPGCVKKVTIENNHKSKYNQTSSS